MMRRSRSVWKIPLRATLAPALASRGAEGRIPRPSRLRGDGGVENSSCTAFATSGWPTARQFAAQETQTFRATKVTMAKESFEGRNGATVEGEWKDEARITPGRLALRADRAAGGV